MERIPLPASLPKEVTHWFPRPGSNLYLSDVGGARSNAKLAFDTWRKWHETAQRAAGAQGEEPPQRFAPILRWAYLKGVDLLLRKTLGFHRFQFWTAAEVRVWCEWQRSLLVKRSESLQSYDARWHPLEWCGAVLIDPFRDCDRSDEMRWLETIGQAAALLIDGAGGCAYGTLGNLELGGLAEHPERDGSAVERWLNGPDQIRQAAWRMVRILGIPAPPPFPDRSATWESIDRDLDLILSWCDAREPHDWNELRPHAPRQTAKFRAHLEKFRELATSHPDMRPWLCQHGVGLELPPTAAELLELDPVTQRPKLITITRRALVEILQGIKNGDPYQARSAFVRYEPLVSHLTELGRQCGIVVDPFIRFAADPSEENQRAALAAVELLDASCRKASVRSNGEEDEGSNGQITSLHPGQPAEFGSHIETQGSATSKNRKNSRLTSMSKRLQEFIAQFEAEYKRGENIEALARLLVDENPHWIKSVNANRSQTARTLVRQYRRKLAQSGLKIPR